MNGWKGADEITCISSKGCSVVDYCLVPAEDLDGTEGFMVETMSRCEARLCSEGDQAKCDQVYDELCEGLRKNLKVVKGGKESISQPWFLTDLARLCKSMHRAEAA